MNSWVIEGLDPNSRHWVRIATEAVRAQAEEMCNEARFSGRWLSVRIRYARRGRGWL